MVTLTKQDNRIVFPQSQGTILHGDCTDILKTLGDASIPLVIADPPYGIGYHSNYYKSGNPHAPVTHDWNFQIGAFLQQCARVLKDGGALYLFCRWDVSPLWIPYIQGSGLKLKTIIAWVKDNWSAGDLTGCFGNQYEQILFITKGRHILRGKRWSNVWNFPRVSAATMLHPTQKPTELLERAINASSDRGDTILDCFCGSGSTGEACIRTLRSFLLCDIDKRMVSIARRRLGLSDDCTEEEAVSSPTSTLNIPPPEEWGIHPEQLAEVYATLQENIAHINTPLSLWGV